MALQSITLVPTTTFGTPTGNYDGSSTTFYSNKTKGSGYYGYTDGLHTIAFYLTNFIGKITVQGSLAKDPGDNDWFNVSLGSGGVTSTVSTTGLVSETIVNEIVYTEATTNQKTYNFIGNIVWVRVEVEDFSAGTIRKIIYNY